MKNVTFKKTTLFLSLLLLVAFVGCNINKENKSDEISSAKVESLDSLIKKDRKKFLSKLTFGIDSDLEKTQSIVKWLAINFDWKATDYKQRNVQQIIERGGGNCNDLAKVTIDLINSAAIKIRKVREVNIHIKSDQRQKSAEVLVTEKGFKYSVFGMMHNDHVWIEVYDSKSKEWIPADPSLGIIGVENWMQSRVAFEKKKTLDPGSKDMIVPMAVYAEDENKKLTINRTEYYLIHQFDKSYNNQLSKSLFWKDWSSSIKEIDDKCLLAFEGKLNLHLHQDEIEALSNLYGKMKLEFKKLK